MTEFAETSAALDQLEFLISVNMSVILVAGAINLPVWVLISLSPDLRWRSEGNTSPWHPSLRLWLQPELSDWETVLENIAEALSTDCKTLRLG